MNLSLNVFMFQVTTPIAFLHIGPHKTASTQIQTTFLKNYKEIEKENIYCPLENVPNESIKLVSRIPRAIRDDSLKHLLPLFENFIKYSLENNHNIFLSSEEFDNMNIEQLQRLQFMLKGFQVKVIYVYREWLSQLTSWYFEHEKPETVQYSQPFSAFFMKIMNNLPPLLQPLQTLQNYTTIFGQNNMIIIDYIGVETSQMDISYVILCEIMNVLCKKKELFNIKERKNAKHSLIPTQIFSVVHSYIQINKKLQICNSQFRKHYLSMYNSLLTTTTTVSATYSTAATATTATTATNSNVDSNSSSNRRRATSTTRNTNSNIYGRNNRRSAIGSTNAYSSIRHKQPQSTTSTTSSRTTRITATTSNGSNHNTTNNSIIYSPTAKTSTSTATTTTTTTTTTGQQFPTIKSNLNLLIPYAEYIDTNIRQLYSTHIHYNNTIANRLYREKHVVVEELDMSVLYTDIYWQSWISRQVDIMLQNNHLCPL